MRARKALRPPKKSVKKPSTQPRQASRSGPASPRTPAPIPVGPGAQGFAVVGLGASAGGLEAFEEFFRKVPADIGMAFVLVSHLDPTHESILAEIVQRATKLPVVEVTDQMAVKPNCIFVIPPNRDLTIFHGALQLTMPETPRGQRLTIDGFFRSLAEDQGENAIGVVLSGTGTDGSLGLRAILGAGGITFAQEPTTAKYDGMPAAAVRSGYVTHVLPVGKMPEAMRTAAQAIRTHPVAPTAPAVAYALNQVLATLRSRTGHDFSQYKKSTVVRRIERRMASHEIETVEVYGRYLKEHPDEVQALFKELLINVTSFFRDPEAFEALRREVLPRVVSGKPEGWTFRVWVAGCASGEEAYSIGILLRELMDETRQEFKIQIYATDLDEDAIALARAGAYSPNIVQDVSPERLRRFFVKTEAGYRVKKEIREMVVFAVQNVIKDPPFTKLDLLACRNLLIYVEPDLQDRIITTFQYALRPGGVLFLSPSESIGRTTDLFKPINRKWKLFEVVPSAASARVISVSAQPWKDPVVVVTARTPERKEEEVNVAELTIRSLLESFAPASVVTDLAGNIVYVHGDTGRYLRPAPGMPTLNVIEMARGGLEAELRAALRVAARGARPSVAREVPVRVGGTILLTVRPLGPQRENDGLLLVSFLERPRPAQARADAGKGAGKGAGAATDGRKVRYLEASLASAKDLLRTTSEDQQASTEELKSINEELQSTNEELQSTNEELETSKEELQSVNEELVTVNAEFQSKIEQLAGMQNDMRNLLDNVSGGVVFLDGKLAVRRFTREATKLFRLVPTDLGRALGDIKAETDGEGLLAGARQVIETLVPWEREITTSAGASFLARIQPYRTLDNVIDGVVMNFTDITVRTVADAALREARRVAQSIVDAVREPLVVLDAGMKVVSASRAFYEQFKVKPGETVGRFLHELGNRQWDIPALRELLAAVQVEGRAFDEFTVEHDFPEIGHRRLVLNARRILSNGPEDQLILLAIDSPPP